MGCTASTEPSISVQHTMQTLPVERVTSFWSVKLVQSFHMRKQLCTSFLLSTRKDAHRRISCCTSRSSICKWCYSWYQVGAACRILCYELAKFILWLRDLHSPGLGLLTSQSGSLTAPCAMVFQSELLQFVIPFF